jgi:hypothetical protein
LLNLLMLNSVTITLNTSFPTPVSAVTLANKLEYASSIKKMKVVPSLISKNDFFTKQK